MKKRIVLTLVAAVAAVSLMGCGITTTSTYTETTTDANGNTVTTTTTTTNGETTTETTEETSEELVTYEFETFDNVQVVIDENSIITQEPSEDPENSDLVSESARGNIIAPGRDYVYLEDDDYYYVADLSRQLITVADKTAAAQN